MFVSAFMFLFSKGRQAVKGDPFEIYNTIFYSTYLLYVYTGHNTRGMNNPQVSGLLQPFLHPKGP